VSLRVGRKKLLDKTGAEGAVEKCGYDITRREETKMEGAIVFFIIFGKLCIISSL